VTVTELAGAGDAIFAAQVGDIVGPLPSSLGPALFRVNGTLAARVTTFENAETELSDELAGERARRMIEAQAEEIDDLLAGGATLEELTGETDMTLDQIDWSQATADGVAAYGAFRQAAASVSDKDYPEVAFLRDGGLFALRLDEVIAPRPERLDDARDRVIAGWTLAQIEQALQDKADTVIADLAMNGDFAETGLSYRVENGLTRTAYLDGTPADFMNQVFEMDRGDMRVVAAGSTVFIVRLDDILRPDDTPELSAMKTAINDQLNQALGQALFEAVVRDAQLRAKPMLDQQALNAVQATFQ